MSFLKRISAMFLSIIMGISAFFGATVGDTETNPDEWNTNYSYVFVHGLMGWGSYDTQYKFMPYWGMFGGELMSFLNRKGFNCYAASVAPTSSAWDRACELYAQLTGTVTDYGAYHSQQCGHDRYGTDFTGKALIPSWSETDKINLLGHSFGGATVRTLAYLMAEGDTLERENTPSHELSPLFEGGKADWIYSVTSLAAPHNGTTAYCSEEGDNVGEYDTAAYDMYIDNALALNQKLSISNSTYYFSIACSMTTENEDGTHSPVKSDMESLFVDSSAEIGRYKGETLGGYVIDEKWYENDGLVNTYSALAPIGNPSTDFDASNVQTGIWNVMPIYEGDHMSLQGGLFKVNNVKPLYIEHLSMINNL